LEQSTSDHLERLARTPDELREAVRGLDEPALAHRATPAAWSAKDVICHLRDIEDLVVMRFHTMLVTEDPPVLVVGATPADPAAWGFDDALPYPMDADRWRDDRQYERNDAGDALEAFARNRARVLTLLARLTPDQWERGALHPDGRRWTFRRWTAGMSWHDTAHLAQLTGALAG
jgi:hypothetical protein